MAGFVLTSKDTHMKYVLTSLLIVFLAACGGGSAGPGMASSPTSALVAQPFECVSVMPSGNKFKAVSFDVRRDDPGWTDTGLEITSMAAVKLMIDRARCTGFDTALLQINIPIDTKTGLLRGDQPLPKDFWQYVSYAKSLGMRVIIKPIPVNYVNDVHISLDTANLPIIPTFQTIQNFQVELARQAQKAGVDMIYVGVLQYGIDTADHVQHWLNIIQSIRSVYQGQLIYASCWVCTHNSVWSQVDIVAITGSMWEFDHQAVTSLGQHYNKPVMLDDVHVTALPAGYVGPSLWDMIVKGIPIRLMPDYVEQQRKFEALFKQLAHPNPHLQGFVIGEYMPWLQNKNLQNPVTNIEHQFKKYDQLGHSLYNNLSAQKVIQQHIVQLWQ